MDPKLTASLSHFAARFTNELQNGKNVVCSPLSAGAVLALSALGSRGDTREELLRAMATPDDDAIRSLFIFVTSSLKSVEGITLRMANRVYVTDRGTLKPEIKKDAEKVFGSGLQQVNFVENVAAAGIINNWIAKQTNNLIKDLVDPAALDSYTRLLLVNAVYFQGFWKIPFLKSNTRDRPFHVNSKTEIKVPMMFNTNVHFLYKHSPELKAQLLQMPHEGGRVSMVIVLPDEVEGLAGVLEQLAAGHDLWAEVAGMRRTLLEVTMPKFKVETQIDLVDLLRKMGIKSIFSEEDADIQMLTSNERLFVYKAIQRAVIEVDETGTEAAACTAFVTSVPRSAHISRPPIPKKFTADRPFLYLLTIATIPVFVGIYQNREFAVLEPPKPVKQVLGRNKYCICI